MLNYVLQIVISAVAYGIFHWFFFLYSSVILDKTRLSFPQTALSYILNFALFTFTSVQHFHLAVNWTLILLLLFVEIRIFYEKNIFITATIALDGATMGLATNIFTRCISSIVMNRPLSHFDNNVDLSENIKIYPVTVAFLLAGLIFYFLARKRIGVRDIIYQYAAGTRFLFALKCILYVFLLLNLLAYYTEGNSLSMKLWGIKSVLFVMVGSVIVHYYIARLSRIELFQRRISNSRKELIYQKQAEEQLRYIAFTDVLTGCYNRSYAIELFREYEETSADIVLCFLDLDRLKYVNDNYGHYEGDHYLLAAANRMQAYINEDTDYIFRYGGDEFLILYVNRSIPEIAANMKQLKADIKALSFTKGFPYELSLSCGIASRNEAKNLREVVALADSRMYLDKKAHPDI